MIITLEEAKKIDEEIEEADLLGLEMAVRELTNNKFQKNASGVILRHRASEIIGPNTIRVNAPVGLRVGDRIEITGTVFNGPLHTIKSLHDDRIVVEGEPFIDEKRNGLYVTKIWYPPDVEAGVKKLIDYDKKTSGNIGVKSRSISRVSETYFDVTSGENTNGYPSSLFDFIKKYKKIRWGS